MKKYIIIVFASIHNLVLKQHKKQAKSVQISDDCLGLQALMTLGKA